MELKLNKEYVEIDTLGPSPEDLEGTMRTDSIADRGEIIPGELQEDGSWIDMQGFKHYPYGVKYKFSKGDRRKTAHGAYAGKHRAVRFSDTEVAERPVLAVQPKDYKTVLMYMQGLSRREIAELEGISEITVTQRLAKPEVKNFLAAQKENWTDDIHALTELAIQTLRDSQDRKQDMKNRLAGADKILRANDRLGGTKPTSKEETATTQLQQVLAHLEQRIEVNVNVSKDT